MSFEAASNRILVKNTSNEIVFDTDRHNLHIFEEISVSFTLPIVARNTPRRVIDTAIHTFAYSPSFIMHKGDSNIMGSSFVNIQVRPYDAISGAPFMACRVMSFFLSGNKLYVRDDAFCEYHAVAIPSENFNLSFYIGGYDA